MDVRAQLRDRATGWSPPCRPRRPTAGSIGNARRLVDEPAPRAGRERPSSSTRQTDRRWDCAL